MQSTQNSVSDLFVYSNEVRPVSKAVNNGVKKPIKKAVNNGVQVQIYTNSNKVRPVSKAVIKL